jgi:hypothetical protein
MAQFDQFEDDDDLLDMQPGSPAQPAPADSITGDQTTSQKVAQRIADIRNPQDSSAASPETAAKMGSVDYAPDPSAVARADDLRRRAREGRGFNALVAATGLTPDNSGYAELDKEAEKTLDRSEMVKKMIAANQVKSVDQGIRQQAVSERMSADKARQGIDQDKLKAYNDRTKAMSGNAGSRIQSSNIRAANTILSDPNMKREQTKLNTSRSAQSLIDSINNGELTDSKNISKQLTNMISTIELGTPGGVGDRQAMGVDTLYSKLQGALGYLEGGPTSTIPKAYLDQLESEVHALGDRAAKNYKTMSDSILEGADLSAGQPDADVGQVYQLAKQRRDSMLKGSGYDPSTGDPIARKTNRKGGGGGSDMVKMKAPNGSFRMVPISEKKAAIAAGGTEVQ